MESPWTIGILGAISVAIAVGAWLQTGHKYALVGMAAAAILTAAGIALERSVITEREAVEALLYQMAGELERNDYDAILAHLSPQNPDVQSRARAELDTHEFEEVTITRVHEVSVLPDHIPPKAVIRFNVKARGSLAHGYLEDRDAFRYVIFTLLKEGDAWRIVDYEHYPPQQSMMNDPLRFGEE